MLDGFLFPSKLATKAAPASQGAAVASPEKALMPDAPAPAKVPRPDANDGSSIKSAKDNTPPTVPRTLPILVIPCPGFQPPKNPVASAPVPETPGIQDRGALKKFPTCWKKPGSASVRLGV